MKNRPQSPASIRYINKKKSRSPEARNLLQQLARLHRLIALRPNQPRRLLAIPDSAGSISTPSGSPNIAAPPPINTGPSPTAETQGPASPPATTPAWTTATCSYNKNRHRPGKKPPPNSPPAGRSRRTHWVLPPPPTLRGLWPLCQEKSCPASQQDNDSSTYAPLLKKENGPHRWNLPAKQI